MTKKTQKAGGDRVTLGIVSHYLVGKGKIEKFSPKEWKKDVETYFGGRCAYCGMDKKPLHREHIIPINKNRLGLRHNGNIVPACNVCNTKKRQYDGDENGKGYIRFCREHGNKGALARIRRYMKDKGYKPFTADKTTREKIKRMIEKANQEMGLISDKFAKRIAVLMAKMIK